MEQEILSILKEMQNKPDFTLYSALISVSGALIVAIITTIFQSKTTKKIINSEDERSIKQFKQKQYETWENEFRKNISFLLSEIDFNKTEGIKKDFSILIYNIQLMLNCNDSIHSKINNVLNEIGKLLKSFFKGEVNDFENKILLLQGELIDLSKEVLYLPNEKI